MRRLLHWTFHALAAASLVLCLATAMLWVRSYWVNVYVYAQRPAFVVYHFQYRAPQYDLWVSSRDGHLEGLVGWSGRPDDPRAPPWEFGTTRPRSGFSDQPTNFKFSAVHQFYAGYAYTTLEWAVPAWALVSSLAVLPAIVAFRRRGALRRRRARLGLCPACGYDLRATPDRCPECGTAVGGGGVK